MAGNCCQPVPTARTYLSAHTARPEAVHCWSSMEGQSFPWILPLALLVVLGHPLDTSVCPAVNTGTSAVLDETLEQWDLSPEMTPLRRVELTSWRFKNLDLLMVAISLGWWLSRSLWRFWGEEEQPSPPASTGTGYQGHSCCKEMFQLLRDSRTLMWLYLHRHPLQRPGEKRPRKWGLWKRRKIYFSP
ncbi:uncharacterized protein LOC111923651 isoform X2 [Cyanistes caeruleus]|uniref:uncharacterized protein LOC111923651 isoform X2 n=1 Tax=Cyanistes caeruleus TaxID=156563 RepID=UPI000CDA5FB4|nr:uncharacterized protein LOC111923651 isoform X2 [Cyanistes caeruleus]